MKIREAYTIYHNTKITEKLQKLRKNNNNKSHKNRINIQNPTLKNDLITEKIGGGFGLWGLLFGIEHPLPHQTTMFTHYGALKNPSNQTLKLKEPLQPDLKVKRSFDNRYM